MMCALHTVDDRGQSVYANVVSISASPFDFQFEFGFKVASTAPQEGAEPQEGRLVARVVMSPQRAKSLLGVLQEIVQRYENGIGGEIPVPPFESGPAGGVVT